MSRVMLSPHMREWAAEIAESEHLTPTARITGDAAFREGIAIGLFYGLVHCADTEAALRQDARDRVEGL